MKRMLEVKILESDIQIPQIEEQYNKCPKGDKKTELENKLRGLKLEKEKTKQQLCEVARELDYRRIVKATEDELKQRQVLEDNIALLYNNFRNAM